MLEQDRLVDFSKIKRENMVLLDKLETDAIPIQLCSELVIKRIKEKKDVFLVIPITLLASTGNLEKTFLNVYNQTLNMGIPFDLDFTGASDEQIFICVEHFFKDKRSVKYVLSVVSIVAELCLWHRTSAIKKAVFRGVGRDTLISKKAFKLLYARLKDQLDGVCNFLDSLPLFLTLMHNGFLETYSEDTSIGVDLEVYTSSIKKVFEGQDFEIVDDVFAVPKNVVCLFYNVKFLSDYYKRKLVSPMKYYHQQFTQYIFNGKNLFYHFGNPYNHLMHLVVYASSNSSAKEVKRICKK